MSVQVKSKQGRDHCVLSLLIMSYSFLAMNWLSMMRASLLPSWQQLIALEIRRWCSFSTPMLQWISIFMYSPQCRFSQRRFTMASSLHSLSRTSTSLSIFSTKMRALRISSKAFSCFFISLSMAALLRQVGTISYFSQSLKSLMRFSSRSMAQLTALSAIMQWRFFLRMQAKLLKVSILSLVRVVWSVRQVGVCGSITMSTALEMNLMLPPSSSSLMFSMASRFTFWMNFPISSCKSYSSLRVLFSSSISDRWISFYSQRMHQMELASSRSLNFRTTAQMQLRICWSLTLLSQISSPCLSIELVIIIELSSIEQSRAQSCSTIVRVQNQE